MIKPDALWSFLKRSEDGSEMTVGRICRALAGHAVDPPLDANERLMLNMIMESNEWHTEATEASRQRKRAYRESMAKSAAAGPGSAAPKDCPKDKTDEDTCPKDIQNVPGTKEMSPGQNGRGKMSLYPSVRPSVHPSVRPSKNESVCLTRTRAREGGGENVDNPVDNSPNPSTPPQTPRMDVPTEDAVAEIASTAMGVGADYARWWHREMTARGWTNTDGTRVHNGNWRPTLKSWRNRASGDELAEAREYASQLARKRQRAEKPPIWTLCAERCANCGGNGCQKGRKTPPEELEPPIPPQECPDFKAKGGENGRGNGKGGAE